jgi:hypothetical protein
MLISRISSTHPCESLTFVRGSDQLAQLLPWLRNRELCSTGEFSRGDPAFRDSSKIRPTGYLVALTAFFPAAGATRAFAMLDVVSDLHGDCGADSGEAVDVNRHTGEGMYRAGP